MAPAASAQARPLSLPWWPGGRALAPDPSPSAAAQLQEVAPPPAVQQLERFLAEREPRLEILSPRADETLAPGPWTLRLRLQDWPLAEPGDLGLGPHLVAQLDDEPAQRLTSLESTMPPLRPGSHRLTVYAAKPWGEAVKSPGSHRQIALHRAAENPQALPAPGSPQLILASPTGLWGEEPVLIDWLLLDAPLKDLRSEGADWRLRISVNGDSFLVDRQTPLWLKGWPAGRSGILLELVDGRGEPLNPPFNSVVTEVERNPSLATPVWLGGRLDQGRIERLLGLAPALAGEGEAEAEAEEPPPPPVTLPEEGAAVESTDPLHEPPLLRSPAGGSATTPEATTPEETAGDRESATPPVLDLLPEPGQPAESEEEPLEDSAGRREPDRGDEIPAPIPDEAVSEEPAGPSPGAAEDGSPPVAASPDGESTTREDVEAGVPLPDLDGQPARQGGSSADAGDS